MSDRLLSRHPEQPEGIFERTDQLRLIILMNCSYLHTKLVNILLLLLFFVFLFINIEYVSDALECEEWLCSNIAINCHNDHVIIQCQTKQRHFLNWFSEVSAQLLQLLQILSRCLFLDFLKVFLQFW